MLWILLFIQTSFANEILLPAFSVTPDSEPAGSEIVYAAMVQALQDRDIAFLDSSDLEELVGAKATNCHAVGSCPGNLWEDLEGELAVVAVIAMRNERIDATFEFHRRGADGAIEVFQAEFGAEEADMFAVDAALIAEDLLKLGDQAGPGVIVAAPFASATDALEPNEADAPPLGPIAVEANEEVEAPVETPVVYREELPMSEEDERRYMGVSAGLYQEYQASGDGREEFLANNRIRARTFFVELAPGVTFGDIRRRFASRASLLQRSDTEFAPIGYYQRDQLIPGTAFGIVAGIGYAPTWWLELGANVGMEFPRKELITGWEAYGSKEDFQSETLCETCSDQTVFQPATAVTFLIEPRVRFVLAPRGVAKPFVVGGWSTRMNDAYETPDLDKVAFPDRPGVQSFGPLAGVGIAIDPRKRASGFVEATGTMLLGPGVLDEGRQYVSMIPEPVEGIGYIMTVRAGVTSRF
jgi:hypothetical protein